MASLFNRVVSWLFYLSWRGRLARWLVAIVLGWWGLIVSNEDPERGWLIWGLTLGMLAFTVIAQACSYVLYRRDGRPVERPWRSLDGVVRTTATGYFTKSHALGLSPVFGFNLVVQVRWQRGYRPPFLAAIYPADMEPRLAYQGDGSGLYAEWYPESRVETVWFWSAGRECYGLRLYFAGRWLLLELDETDAAAIRQLLVG